MVCMTSASPYVVLDPLTGRTIDKLSPTIQENRSQQDWFDQAPQSFEDQEGKLFKKTSFKFSFVSTYTLVSVRLWNFKDGGS